MFAEVELFSGPNPVVKQIAKVDWFADLHSFSPGKLTLVGGLAECGADHPCGIDQFVEVQSLNRSVLVLAPRRNIDAHEAECTRTHRTHVKKVTLDHVVLHIK